MNNSAIINRKKYKKYAKLVKSHPTNYLYAHKLQKYKTALEKDDNLMDIAGGSNNVKNKSTPQEKNDIDMMVKTHDASIKKLFRKLKKNGIM